MTQPAPPSRLNPTPPSSTQPLQGTPAEQNVALEALRALNARGAAPTSHNATAPADQKYVAYFEADGTLAFTPNKNYDANAPKLTVYGSADSGYFRLDNAGNAVPVQQPNADALIDKAVDRQIKEGDRNARQRNLETTGFYGTDAERATFENNARARGLDADRIKLERDKFNTDTRQKDTEEARLAQVATANIAKTTAETGLVGAQTGRVGAETEQIGAQTAALQAKTPSEIEENLARAGLAGAQKGLAQQQVEDLKRKAQLPTIEDLGTGATYGVMGPTGQIEERYRQGYVPKTTAEVGARIGQINALANQKRDELMAKVGAGYTAEQAYADFQKWHGQNVQPHIQGLQAAGEEAALTRGKEIATMRTAAQTAALGAGTQAINAYEATKGRRVGMGAADVMKQAATGNLKGVDWQGSALYKGRDPQEIAAEATAQALKYIDPTAAQIAGQGQPTWTAQNPRDVLNSTSLWGTQPAVPAGLPGPPAVTPPSVVTPPPPATVGDPWDAWRARQATDAAQQQTDAGIWAARQAELAEQAAAAQAQTDADAAALAAQQQQNDVYAYAGQPVAAMPRRAAPAPRRGAPPVPAPVPTVVNQAPFNEQALAAGLGGGGLQWTPAQPPTYWPVGDETYPGPNPNQGYVPAPYVYGGMYATPTPY